MYRAYDRWDARGGRPEQSRPHMPQRARSSIGPTNPWGPIIHPLMLCPPLPPGMTYTLVKRSWPGTRVVLAEGQTQHLAPTLNLAGIRQEAATVGANEVHILSS